MKVYICQSTKTAMQSGRAKTKRWRLSFEPLTPKFVDPVMGWVGQQDTTQQLDLYFDTRDQAVGYAERHGYAYKIIKPKKRAIKPKSYADNFRYHRVG